MPVWALEVILYLGKHALEYAQKNWTGEQLQQWTSKYRK